MSKKPKCGPSWLPDKINIFDSEYFLDSCVMHDEDYSKKSGKWKADLAFLERNTSKIKRDNLPVFKRITRTFHAIILFVGVNIPLVSHVSYYWNDIRKFFKG